MIMETNKRPYQAPELEVYMIEVEEGFALSVGSARTNSQFSPEYWETENF